MGDKTIKDSFKIEAGSGKEAYLILDRLFTDNENRKSFMDLENRYQTLLVRTWLPSTEPEEFSAIINEMGQIRRQQISMTSDCITNPKTGEAYDIDVLFERAKNESNNLNEWECGNLRVMENHCLYLSAFKKDPQFADRYINTLKDSSIAWLKSLDVRNIADAWTQQQFAFESAFKVLKESMIEPARILSKQLDRPVPLSEAALMQLNPGVTNADVTKTLAEMKPHYKDLVARIKAQESTGTTPKILSLPEIPSKVQLRVFERLKDEILIGAGYDSEALNEASVKILFTTGPTGACWGHSKDIVLSVETCPADIAKGIGNTWHEIGHLLYLLEMNSLPPEVRGKPVASFNGFGIHEAVAMTMEQAGLRKRAYDLSVPIIYEELEKAKAEGLLPADFNVNSPALSAENLHRQANHPNLSDMEWCTSELSLTPNMAWRMEAFQKIFDDKLEVNNLPQFWAKEMKEWTGIEYDPLDFKINEDHIFSGLGGYFWAYMTGAFTATYLQDEIIRTGMAPDDQATDIASYSAPYSHRLRERIMRHASKDTPDKLLQTATGMQILAPHMVDIYLSRLASFAKDGMPAPDIVLTKRYSGHIKQTEASHSDIG